MAWVENFRGAVGELCEVVADQPEVTRTANMHTLTNFAKGSSDLNHFSAGEGLTTLIGILKSCPKKDVVVLKCVEALKIFCSNGGAMNQKVILKHGTIPLLVATISETQDLNTTNSALDLLYMYTPTKRAVEEMLQNDAIITKGVTVLERAEPGKSEVLSKCLLILSNVCSGDVKVKLAFAKARGVKAVQTAVKSNPNDKSVNESACALLRSTSIECEQAQVEIAREFSVDLLMTIRNFIKEKGIVHKACATLTNVTNQSVDNRTYFNQGSGVETMVRVLMEYPSDKEICSDALGLIRNAIAGDTKAAEQLANIPDAMTAVSQGMLHNPQSHEAQYRGSQVLRFANFCAENRSLMPKANGIRAICGALKYANKNKTIGGDFYINAILALGNSCFNNETNKTTAGKSGALGEMLKLLFRHRDLLDVQEAGLRTLRCLTDQNEFNARLAAAEKALSLCTMDLVGHVQSADICENGFAVLLNLCYCREMLEKMLEADVESIVITTLEDKHPRNRIVQIQGQRILVVIQTEPVDVTDNPSQIANRYEDYIDEVVLPTRSSGSLRRALCG